MACACTGTVGVDVRCSLVRKATVFPAYRRRSGVTKTDQVFISHTSDMASFPAGRSYVQAVLDAVGRVGMSAVDMRYFAARDQKPADYCRQRVRDCEIYVAVIGFRYGTLVPGEDISYTELEFEEAGVAGMPRLVFLLEEAASPPADLGNPDRRRAEGFRRQLLGAGLMVRFFASDASLELEVFHALTEVAAGGPAAVPRQLPAAVPYFVGRLAELAVLSRLAPGGDGLGTAGTAVIAVIGGTAGVGKTALAVYAAHQLACFFPDGQLFVRLHGHTPGQRPVDPVGALASMLLAVGVAPQQIPEGAEERAGLWRERMAGRRALVLLDDAAGSEQVRPLLPATVGTMVLVTSRHRLSGLPEALPVTLDSLDPADAAWLFARLADRPGLSHSDQDVAEVVALCGHLPLAISMVAGQLKHHPAWTVADLARELKSDADRLTAMRAENTSVTASFELSYRNLSTAQKRLFRRLGLHPGTDIDAYAAAALNNTDPGTTRRLLDDLFGYHLIDEPSRGRYRFHDLIRQHASSLAGKDRAAQRDAAVSRLLDYYLHTARAADRYLARRAPTGARNVLVALPQWAPDLPTREDASSWMEAERINLDAATGYAAAHNLRGHAIAIPAAMHGFLRTRGHWDQALSLHHTALIAARQAGDLPAEADGLNDLGAAQYATGDFPAAFASLTCALTLYRQLGNRIGEANALGDLGVAQFAAGDYPAAITSLTEALELHRSLGDRSGEARALSFLGVMNKLSGDLGAAIAAQERALELCRSLGDRIGEADALGELGEAQRMAADFPAAIASLTRALELSRDLGDRVGEANTLNFLGLTLEATGDYPAAAAALTRSLELCREEHHLLGEANALNYLGIVQQKSGDYPAAIASLTRALQLYGEHGQRHGEANALHILGIVRGLTGDHPAATACYEQALERYREVGDRTGEAELLNNMGDLALTFEAPAQAHTHYELALTVAVGITSAHEEARALEGIGQCQLRQGHPDAAAPPLRQALAIYQRLGSANAQRVEKVLHDHHL